MKMKKTKVYTTLTIVMLILSSIGVLVPKVSASGPQHRIILPFHTSWENDDPLSRIDSVDFKKDFSSPHLVYLDNEVAPPSNIFYDFGFRQLKANGTFDSSSSHCYFNLFDPTPNSEWGPPFRLKSHTFINIWYYHDLLADCMIDVELYNDNTGKWWNASDVNDGNGHYIVDQNGVRLHPAHRWNDTIGSWNFSSFDLSMIYEDGPENWFVSKIWVGFDNRVDGDTGQARTYFDMLYISYGIGDKKEETDENSYACTSGSIVAWHYTHLPNGKYGLWVKVELSGHVEGQLDFWWGYSPFYPYTLKVDLGIDGSQAQAHPAPTGYNLRDGNESMKKVGEFILDTTMTLLGFTPFIGPAITAADIVAKFYGLTKTPEPEPTYEFPHAWRTPNSTAMGECYILIPLDPGENSISITVSVDYCYMNLWAQDVVYKTLGIPFHFNWSSQPDYVNLPPKTPSTPSGSTYGHRNVWYTYSASTTDPDGDNVCYQFEFTGPSTNVSFTAGWYPSGQTGNITVQWEPSDPLGTYYVRVHAQDVYDAWGGWSASLQVSIRDPTLTISASSEGTTNPAPGTYTYSYGSSVTVTATAYSDYVFNCWLLDGSTYYQNPITVTMNSDHTLTAYFRYGGSGGGSSCPTLFVWNGNGYVDYGVIKIHNPTGEDVIREVPIQSEDVCINSHKAKFRLREGWEGLNYSESVIDQVKLYAIGNDGNRHLCPLISAEHSRLGNVLPQLLLSDDYRAQMLLLETVDLTFIVPWQNIQGFTFAIEGCNIFKSYD